MENGDSNLVVVEDGIEFKRKVLKVNWYLFVFYHHICPPLIELPVFDKSR